jgi:hypothetical protein
MTRTQAGIPDIAAFLIGLHSRTLAQQSNTGFQTIEESGANPLRLDLDTVNVLNANAAARRASLAESAPKGYWIQGWNDPQQTFTWKVQVPRASEQIVDMAKNAKVHHVALSFNLLMYEGGTVLPASLDAVKLFGKTVRGG